LKWPILVLAGILVIGFYCAFTFTSIALFPPPFSPVTNWLSDLGNSSFSPKGAVFYNVGCVLTGLALFPFFAGFYKWYTDEKWRKLLMTITQVVGFISAFALIMIGVFSANASLMTHRKFMKLIGYYGLVVAAINLLFVAFSNTPLLEWFTVFTALGYVALLSYNTYKSQLPA
jgi:hypothetical protein